MSPARFPSAPHSADHPPDEIVAHTAIRGVAALGVVAYHVSLGFRSVDAPLVRGLAGHAYLFVDLFFMLSGFILCLKYLAWFERGVGRATFGRFMALRFARLYPAYLLWLAFAVAASFSLLLLEKGVLHLPDGTARALAMHVAGVQWLLPCPVHWNTPLWSIGVEFILYALFPLLAVALCRRGPVAGWAGVALAAAAILAIVLGHGTIDVIEGPLSVLRGVASFAAGIVIAGRLPGLRALPTPALSVLQAAALAAAIVAIHTAHEVAAVACFAALVHLGRENRGILYRVAALRPLRRAGDLSFSVYLSHAPLFAVPNLIWWKLRGAGGASLLEGYVVVTLALMALSLFAASLALTWVERPAQRRIVALLGPDPRPVRLG